MRRNFKVWAIILLSILIIVSISACTQAQPSSQPTPSASTSPSAAAGPQGAQGPRPSSQGGTPNLPAAASQPAATPSNALLNAVRGKGTISVDSYANLYFGTAGQIASVTVDQGDKVTKGTVLAKLDTTNLEASLSKSKVDLNTAKLAQAKAKTDLETAKFNLDRTQPVSDIKDAITKIQNQMDVAQANMALAQATNDTNSVTALNNYLSDLKKSMDAQQKRLKVLLTQTSYADVATFYTGITSQTYDRLTVQDVRIKELAVESAQLTLDQSTDTIDQAQKNLNLIQTQLNQATISAPFNGIVAKVNQNPGDIVSAPDSTKSPIIYMIDPNTLQLTIGVNELDVPKIKVGQKAAINIDAFPSTKIEGQITVISPVPTVSGGITDYTVTIALTVPANLDVRVGMNANAVIASP
jgi:HlyD family secretion protein